MTEGNATTIAPPCEDGAPDEVAAHWAAYLHSGEATDEAHDRFRRWLDRSYAHVHAYRRIEQLWRDLGMTDADPDLAKMPLADSGTGSEARGGAQPVSLDLARTTRARRGIAVLRRPYLAAGAALAASLLLAVGIANWPRSPEGEVRVAELASATGQVRTVVLADGSRLTLMPASALTVRLSPDMRQVEVRQGGAYFDVAPDAVRPFMVRTLATQIRVVGTAFEVARQPDGVRVSVARGIVDVGRIAAAKAKEWRQIPGVRITANQQVVASANGALSAVQAFDARNGLAWRSGLLVFRDMPLDQVLSVVNPYRHVKVRLADPALAAMRVTASLPANETDKLLSALEATRPVKVQRSPTEIVIAQAPAGK